MSGLVRVGDVLQLRRTPVQIDPLAEYTLIGVYSFGKGIFHRPPQTGADLGDYRFFQIQPRDLVLSNIQAWEGAIALAASQDAGTVGTHRFLTYTAVDGRIDTNWARYFFLSEAGFALIQQAAPGTVKRNRTLSIERFESLQIPIPPIDEQRAVAERLDDAVAGARQLDALIADSPPQELLASLPRLTQELITSTASERRTVRELADIVSDVVHPGDDLGKADAFVGLQHVEPHSGKRLGQDPVGAEKGRKFRFAPGDVLYGYLRPYQNKVLVADLHGLCSVDQYVLRPRPGVDPELLAYVLRSQHVLEAAVGLTHRLQLPRLRSGLLLGLDVVWPDATVLPRLDQLVQDIRRASVLRRKQSSIAGALPAALLNDAFSHAR